MAQLTVTNSADGSKVDILEENILSLLGSTLGSVLTYIDETDGQKRVMTISDNTNALSSVSSVLFATTDANGGVVYLNKDRVLTLGQVTSTGLQIHYNYEGQTARVFQTSDSLTTFLTNIETKNGESVYAFDDVNATNNTISLAAANGDLTSTFTVGTYFQVQASATASVNGTYVVASSAYAGSKTVITVGSHVKDVPSGATETGIVIL